MKKIIIQVIALVLLQYTYAQPGSLDPTFGIGGKVMTAIGTTSDQVFAMDIQSDGKIVVSGSSDKGNNKDFALVRYNYDGSLDVSFDSDGIVTTPIGLFNDIIYAIKIQSDGKIVVAGSVANGNTGTYTFSFALARYNSDGSLDNSFGSKGKVITAIGSTSSARAIGIQEDGKIVVAGSSMGNFALVRYNSDGTLDVTFDNDGIVTTSLSAYAVVSSGANALAIQKDGRIIAAGDGSFITNNYGPLGDFAMARYNTDGSLDSSFNHNGKVLTDFMGEEGATAIALQDDGKIILGGNRYYGHRNDCIVARYNANGSSDSTFHGGAAFPSFGPTSDYTTGVAVQSDGKVLLSGVTFHRDSIGLGDYDFAIARYTVNGQPDATFGNGGRVITAISTPRGNDHPTAIKLYYNRIYLAGYSNSRFSIAAYQKDAVVLPLTLLNFSADLSNLSVLCRWQTVSEINTSHFIVQRSYDGISFENIGRVQAEGNISNVYHFTDDLASVINQRSTIYYRLEMIDKDGTASYSSVASVKTTQKSSFTIFPNPAHTFVRVKGNGLQQIAVFDQHGKLVLIKNFPGNDSNTINTAHLPNGVYIVRLKDKQENVQTEKLVIK